MSEAAESSETSPRHPALGELLDLWAIVLLIGLVMGVGLSPALKGSRAGLDWWIDRVDLAAGITGQFAAIATWLLTIQFLLAGLRAKGQRTLAWTLTVLGIWPVVSLMGAQRAMLPPELWLGAVGAAAAGCVLSGSANRRSDPWLALVLVFAGASLWLELALMTGNRWFEHAAELLPRLRTLLGLGAVAVALWMHLGQTKRAHLLLPGFAAVSGLLFLIAARASEPEIPTWILVVGRTLQSMTPDTAWAHAAWTPSLQLCLAVVLVSWTATQRLFQSSPTPSHSPLLAAVCSLTLAVPTTPLAVATMTLLGVAALPRALSPLSAGGPPKAARS